MYLDRPTVSTDLTDDLHVVLLNGCRFIATFIFLVDVGAFMLYREFAFKIIGEGSYLVRPSEGSAGLFNF